MGVHNNEIGLKIKEIRLSMGLTMEDFGQMFDPPASKGVVSNWENFYNYPTMGRLERIAELGDIHILELMNGRDYRKYKDLFWEITGIIDHYYDSNDDAHETIRTIDGVLRL